ncbi:MAG: hypothetical protein AB7U75_14925 [Hyphomicrobiaceae bacterium]
MKPLPLLVILLTSILFTAKVIFDKPLSWWEVTAPMWVFILAIIVFYASIWGIVWGAERVLQWFETPEETKQRHAMENAQRALKAFAQRYGGE